MPGGAGEASWRGDIKRKEQGGAGGEQSPGPKRRQSFGTEVRLVCGAGNPAGSPGELSAVGEIERERETRPEGQGQGRHGG